MSDHDDQDDDPGLRSMRAVWLSMRDEEPPAAGLSGLLAAAREKADAMRPKTVVPWWQRALAVLRRPPVLALASVVVLLGGAIALTARNDDMKVEAPLAAERQRAPTEDRAKLETPAPAAAQPPQVAQEPEHEKAEAETKKDVKVAKPPVVHRAPSARTVTQNAPEPDRYGGEDLKAPEPPPPTERPAKERDSRSEGGLAIATDGRAPEVAGEAAPPPKAADETIETTGSTSPGRGQASTAQLVQQCETAAARGDCAATRVTAAKIKKLDAAVYKARIERNQAIARCLK